MLEPKYYHGMISHKRKIFSITGLNSISHKSTNTCYAYDKDERSWSVLPSLNQYKVEVGVVVMSNFLYVFGGAYLQQLNFKCRKIERISLEKLEKWEIVDVILVHSYISPAVINITDDKILLFGGRSNRFG